MNNKDLAKIALVVLGVIIIANYFAMPIINKYMNKEA